MIDDFGYGWIGFVVMAGNGIPGGVIHSERLSEKHVVCIWYRCLVVEWRARINVRTPHDL